jgi:hypothetical protein
MWCFSEILAVPEYLVSFGWNSKNLTKTPDKARYSGTVRISLNHQIKPGTLEQ